MIPEPFMKRSEAGFSLIELAVVVMIFLIVVAIGIPAVRRTTSAYQLDSSGHNVARMLQQVRSAAVKNDTPYYAQFNSVAGPSEVVAVPAIRFNAANSTPAAYNSNVDPTTAVAANISFLAGGGAPPNHAQLETAMGVPVGAPPPALQIGGVIAFNSRGLPCSMDAATPNAWVCRGPVSFEWFMQHGMTGEWEAVTVSPAGRIKAWRMSRNGVWQ
jgi:prepilin-type N-terminal cleavage/methylation domain-containing protein